MQSKKSETQKKSKPQKKGVFRAIKAKVKNTRGGTDAEDIWA